jgi:lipopolysaccharide exporter
MASLRHQTFRGALFMGGTTIAGRILSLGAGIILARLLDPIQFGLVSLCYIVLNVISLLAPLGLSTALVRYQGDRARAAFQVFVWVMLAGMICYLLVVFGREQIAALLGNPEVSSILPWMGILILLDMVGRVPEALLERDLAFKRMSTIAMAGEIIFNAVAIGMAMSGFGVWSLVVGQLARSASGSFLCILWYRSKEWITPQRWDWGVMKDLVRFGTRMVGSAAVTRFYLNVDNFVVGRALGVTALGYYAKAFTFTTSTVDNLNKTIGTVLFPTYAKIQHDAPRLTQAYLRSLKVVASATVPLAFGILVTAPVLVPSLLGDKWLPMVPILQVLALMSVVKPVSTTAGSVFNALGLPGKNMTAGIVVSVAMLGGMAALLPFGAVGVAWAVVGAHVLGYIYNIYQMHKVLPVAARGMVPTVMPAILASLAMTGCMHLTRLLIPVPESDMAGIGVLAAMCLVGLVAYGTMFFVFQRPLVMEIRDLFKSRQGGREKPPSA